MEWMINLFRVGGEQREAAEMKPPMQKYNS